MLRLLPIIISFLLLAAHFYRSGSLLPVALCLALPLVLLFRQTWAARLVQAALLLGALEWLHTLYAIAQLRIQLGQPWGRLAIILGLVALFTALSALALRGMGLRSRS